MHKESYTECKNDTILNSCFFTTSLECRVAPVKSTFSTFNTTVSLVRVILMIYFFGMSHKYDITSHFRHPYIPYEPILHISDTKSNLLRNILRNTEFRRWKLCKTNLPSGVLKDSCGYSSCSHNKSLFQPSPSICWTYADFSFSGRAVWDAGIDRSNTGSRVRIPLKAWMFVLVFLCCVVLCR
jgi:hypothetical protein